MEGDSESGQFPMAAWFLGPKAEQGDLWFELLDYIFQDYIHWRRNYFPNDPVVISRSRRREHERWATDLNSHLDAILNDLKAHFPFYSPRYLAHMLSEQTLPGVLGYFAGMLYNPNNVTVEAAPVTVRLELEVGRMISAMLGFNPKRSWAHVCSGGTVANLEALWVARTVQFVPFIVRDFCAAQGLGFQIKTANGQAVPIRDVDDRCLIHLRPNESIFSLRKLAGYMVNTLGWQEGRVLADLNQFILRSEFNINQRGLHSLLKRLDLEPVIFVSSAAHYSIRKAANALGYGEASVRSLPVDEHFRVSVEALGKALKSLGAKQYVAAVVGIVGTTEEGAVDPIHSIRFLRDQFSREFNRSFWLHADAAWGGYFRSLFCGHPLERKQRQKRTLEEICDDYIQAIAAREEIQIKTDSGVSPAIVNWEDRNVYSAFLALADADSITVDPHKMGYIPYPAGIVAFKNGLVTELIVQKAQYISDKKQGITAIDDPGPIDAVGPYILEGSKPGAAAAACWLAHKTIPLEAQAHGKLIRTTVLNARKLTRYLQFHKRSFGRLDAECFGPRDKCHHPFTFVPLHQPDTNILCFIARPMIWYKQKLIPFDESLTVINQLNERIYKATSIPTSQQTQHFPYSQPYFLSRTRFDQTQYGYEALAPILSHLRITKGDYAAHGLFVLRSTVMNPHYNLAESEGFDYLYEFVKYLHRIARVELQNIYRERDHHRGPHRPEEEMTYPSH
jgi:glutamate/tyrosine decarboxylase-like PLP-dependent enzyme